MYCCLLFFFILTDVFKVHSEIPCTTYVINTDVGRHLALFFMNLSTKRQMTRLSFVFADYSHR